MKNLTVFFFAFFFLAFFNSAQSQQGSQNPVGGLSYAPDSNYVIYSQFYKGRNGVALWVHKDSVNWVNIKYDSVLFISNNGLAGVPGSITQPFNGIQEAIQYAYDNSMTAAKIVVIDGGNYDVGGLYIDSIPIQIETQGEVFNFRIAGLNSVSINARKISDFNLIGNSDVFLYADTIQLNSENRTMETGLGSITVRAKTIIASFLIKSAGLGTPGKTSLDLYCTDYYAFDGPWLNGGYNATQKHQTIKFKCVNYYWNHNSDIIGCYQSNLDSSTLFFEVDRILPSSASINSGMIYWQPDGGSGSTTNYNLFFNVGQYVGPGKIFAYTQGKAANRGKLNINFKNYRYTGTSNVLYTGGPGVIDSVYISGKYYSEVPFFDGGVYPINTIFENAEIYANQSLPVIRSTLGTGSSITVNNSILSNDGKSAIFDFANAKIVRVNSAFTYGPLIADPQVTFSRRQELGLSTITSNIYNTDGALTGNRTVTGASNSLDFTGMGNFTATGSGSATYRFNLYPSSSLPVLLEQTSAGDTAYLQLRASLGRATLRATQDIYLEAANSVFVSTLEGSSTGIVSTRPTGELIRREEAFFNAYFISDTITVAASETEINSTFLDAISPSFTISGDSIVYNGTDTAYFDIGYYTEAEVLESATGTYLLELSCYKNGVKVFPSESWHRVYFTATESQGVQSVTKRFTTQLVTGDVLNIRQNGTTGISAALHNFSFTGQKLQ